MKSVDMLNPVNLYGDVPNGKQGSPSKVILSRRSLPSQATRFFEKLDAQHPIKKQLLSGQLRQQIAAAF